MIAIGAPATGKSFFDRENEITEIWELLEKGSILMLGPRRYGKTSIMLNLVEKPKNGWHAFYIDAEWMSKPAQLIAEVFSIALSIESLKAKVLKMAKEGSIDLFEVLKQTAASKLGLEVVKAKLSQNISDDWQGKGRELLGLLDSSMGGDIRNIAIIIDELPWMLESMIKSGKEDETRQFLSFLRALRHTPSGLVNTRFIMAGSIGLSHLLKKINALPTINDLQPIKIGPFSEEKAREFIEKALDFEGWVKDDKLVDNILETIGTPTHPFFLPFLVDFVLRSAKDRELKEIPSNMVTEVYKKRLMGPEGKLHFDYYYQRLFNYYSPTDAEAAKRILVALSREPHLDRRSLFDIYKGIDPSGNIEKINEGFEELMENLAEDFYIDHDGDKKRFWFSSKPLQDWWYRRHYPIEG